MRTIRVHDSSCEAGEATPRTRTLLRSAAAGIADSLPVGTVVSIARVDAVTRFEGASVSRGAVCLASRIVAPRIPSEGPPRIDAWWVSPTREVVARTLRAGVALREASRGLGHALRCVAGFYGRSTEPDLWEAYPLAGHGAVESPAVFLLVADADDADALLAAAPRMLRDAIELLDGCSCAKGCGSCTGRHPRLGRELHGGGPFEEPGRGFTTPDRHEAVRLGRALLDPAPTRASSP